MDRGHPPGGRCGKLSPHSRMCQDYWGQVSASASWALTRGTPWGAHLPKSQRGGRAGCVFKRQGPQSEASHIQTCQ